MAFLEQQNKIGLFVVQWKSRWERLLCSSWKKCWQTVLHILFVHCFSLKKKKFIYYLPCYHFTTWATTLQFLIMSMLCTVLLGLSIFSFLSLIFLLNYQFRRKFGAKLRDLKDGKLIKINFSLSSLCCFKSRTFISCS